MRNTTKTIAARVRNTKIAARVPARRRAMASEARDPVVSSPLPTPVNGKSNGTSGHTNPLDKVAERVAKLSPEKRAVIKAKIAGQTKGKVKANAKKAKATAARKPVVGGAKLEFTRRFARVFEKMFGSHGFDVQVTPDEKHVIIEKGDVTVKVENPNQQYASETAHFTGTKKGRKISGDGRDALAKELGVPKFVSYR